MLRAWQEVCRSCSQAAFAKLSAVLKNRALVLLEEYASTTTKKVLLAVKLLWVYKFTNGSVRYPVKESEYNSLGHTWRRPLWIFLARQLVKGK